MTRPDVSQECCAHIIVVMDAWHCCDCGRRFLPRNELPTFVPKKSHLHVKLEHVTLANAALRKERDDATFEMQERATTLAGHLDAMADLVAEIAALRERAERAETRELTPCREIEIFNDGRSLGWQENKDVEEALNARLALDAGRLDWLERHLFDGKWDGTIGRLKEWYMAGPYRHTLKLMKGNTLREAIDAALASQGGEKP